MTPAETVSNETIMTRYADLPPELQPNLSTNWEQVVTLAIALREEIDTGKWNLGDLALAACDAAVGRPKAGQADRTVAALAEAIGENRSALSNMRNNALFYPPELRAQIPPQIGWRIAAECRGRSGWRPENPVEPVHRERALAFILEAEAKMDRPKPAPPTAADRLRREVERLEHLRDTVTLASDGAVAMMDGAVQLARLALEEESGEVARENPPRAPDHVLPVWSLVADSTFWKWYASLSDEARATAGVVILEGAGWAQGGNVRVRGIGAQ